MIYPKNIVLVLLLSFFTYETTKAQDVVAPDNGLQKEEVTYPNIVKINSLALMFNNLSLIYERALMPKFSVGLGAGYKYAGDIPKFFTVNTSTFGVNYESISGYSITPEARYYLRACDPKKLDGFYASLYMRYADTQSGANFDYKPDNTDLEHYHADMGLREFGIGIQLGYQMIIKERFSLTFMIMGPRISRFKMNYAFDRPPSQQFLDDLSESFNEIIDRFGLDYEVNIEQENELKSTSSFSFVSARFGLSLGYAF